MQTNWFEKGSALGISGKYQEAIDAFKQAIKIKPDYAELIIISVLPMLT